MNLLDYFDKVFIINLDIHGTRWDEFQKRAADLGITGFERYRAVYGDACQHPAWWRAGNGAWGCMMSHAGIAQEAIMDDLSRYLVLEDDVVFSKDFCERLPIIMGQLQGVDWDQLYLGGQHLYVETSPPWPFRDGIVRCKNVNRTHAMAINRRFFLKFYQHILHAPDYIARHIKPSAPIRRPDGVEVERPGTQVTEWFPHIDHQLGYLHELGQHMILAANPWLCGQAAGGSHINGAINPEQWWHDLGWYK